MTSRVQGADPSRDNAVPPLRKLRDLALQIPECVPCACQLLQHVFVRNGFFQLFELLDLALLEVVDDDPDNVESLTLLLRTMGFAGDATLCAEEVADLAASKRPDNAFVN